MLLGAAFILPFAILLACAALEVPMGQGYFWFRYSPVRAERTLRALPAVALGGIAAGAVWTLAARRPRRDRLAAGTVLAAAAVGAGAWVWWAPPVPMNQQWFNITSLSTDGAFYHESSGIGSLPLYLRRFDQDRLTRVTEQMGGTRILSNPPGATVLAYLASRVNAPDPLEPGAFQRYLRAAHELSPEDSALISGGLRVAILFAALWVLAGAAGYGLGRVFLSPAGAAVFAIMATFNPCAVHFAPGKDPAQLLSVNLMLWAWFASWKRRSAPLAAVAGAALLVGLTLSLSHAWVALAALAATLWHDRARLGTVALRGVLPAAAGAAAVVLLVYLAIGWNITATLLAVARKWTALQPTFQMNRAVWYLIGLPIFLLFLSPGFYALLGLSAARRRLNLGTRLVICTAGAMAFIYLVIGLTYELPRLWVVFLPPLALGLAMDAPLLRGRGPHRRAAVALATLVVAQVAFTAFHWTIFDAREAEYRLISKRLYG